MIKEKCLYIYNMRPQVCETIRPEGELLYLENGSDLLEYGVIKAKVDIYSCMIYSPCRIIAFITNGKESTVSNLIFREDADFNTTLEKLKNSFGMNISKQDGKVISYARSISEKLRAGIEVSVFDAVQEDDFVVCPACGVRNDKNSGFDFCLECGEPL